MSFLGFLIAGVKIELFLGFLIAGVKIALFLGFLIAGVKIELFLGFLIAGVKIESSPEFFMAVRTQHAVMLDITTCSIRAVVQTVAAGSKPQGY